MYNTHKCHNSHNILYNPAATLFGNARHLSLCNWGCTNVSKAPAQLLCQYIKPECTGIKSPIDASGSDDCSADEGGSIQQ